MARKKVPVQLREKFSRKVSQLVREGYPQKQAVAIAYSEWRAGKLNPVPPSSALRKREHYGADYEKAERLFHSFTGHHAEPAGEIEAPKPPRVAIVVGTLDFVGYTCVRDGEKQSFIHRFHAADRPLLLASPDGKQLLVSGGRYTFTERGIVDRSDR